MNRFAKWMIDLVLSGVSPKSVSKDKYPGKMPPKVRPRAPIEPPVPPEIVAQVKIDDLYRRYSHSQVGKIKRSNQKGNLDRY